MLDAAELIQDLRVPPGNRLEKLAGRRAGQHSIGVNDQRADLFRVARRYFGTSERFWLNLQSRYDLEVEKDKLGSRLEKEVAVLAPAR